MTHQKKPLFYLTGAALATIVLAAEADLNRKRLGLPGILVLVAVTAGGGIAEMLLAVPIPATAYKLLGHDMRQRLVVKASGSDKTTYKPSFTAKHMDRPVN